MQRFSRRKGLTFEAVPTQYTRSNSYRSQFFACHPSATGKYRCAYCGKKKPKDKITIDHIFPVHCMEKYPAVRKRAALFGIHGSNDMKKLMYCLYAVQSEKRSENGNLDSERLSWKTALVLAASENTYGDTGVFCAISRAKNIYACGM